MTEELTPEDKKILENLVDPNIEVANQYQWDEEFQRNIIGMLLVDRFFLIQSLALVKPSYFINEVHRLVCKIVFDHFKKYKQVPAKTHIIQEVKDAIGKEEDKVKWHYMAELESVYEYYIPGLETRDYLTDKITDFAKSQSLRKAFRSCLDILKSTPDGDTTWMKIRNILRDALIIDKKFETGLEYFQSFVERYARMGQEIEMGEVFTSGFPSIDAAFQSGGLTRGEMASWMGTSGVGKSLALVTAAVENIHKGKKVLYISLEMDEDKIAERFDAQFADPQGLYGVTIGNLLERKEIVCKALASYTADFEDPRLLVIKQFPAGTLDVAMLRAYYNQLGLYKFKPDLVIVDYIGEMKDFPGMPTWESRYRIVRDIRGFAVEEDVCVFTAMQPNRSAREAQKVDGFGSGVIDDENLADAFGQIRPLDACWSINQMQEEKEAGVARIFVIKHRHGKSRFLLHVEYDMDTLKMRQISLETYDQRWKKKRNEQEVRTTKAMSDNVDRVTGKDSSEKSPTDAEVKDAKDAKAVNDIINFPDEYDTPMEPDDQDKSEKE